MIAIKPLASNLCRCPRCQRPFNSGTVAINGMRNLLDAHCETCHAHYYIDLPSGHALFAPTAVDLQTGEVFDPANATWFSGLLARSIPSPIVEHVPIRFQRTQQHPNIVLLNCLDYLYGHCLLKLLNAQHYLDYHPEVACCVLVPKQLAHLVPEGVAEIWEVDLPLKRFQHWYLSLQRQIQEEIDARDTCYLSVAHSHPDPSRYDLSRFVRHRAGDMRAEIGTPAIIFSYREDRPWGASVRRQASNINALFQALKLAFPAMTLIVTGFGKSVPLAEDIVDERVTQFSLGQEQRWLDLYAAADCVVGVHGSNMLLPSGLARHVVELLPEDRLGNITQDLLWPTSSIRDNEVLYRVRFVYGRADLSDVKPQRVASVIMHQLAFQRLFKSMATTSLAPVEEQNGLFDTTDIVRRVPKEMNAYVKSQKAHNGRQLRHVSTRLRIRFQRLTKSIVCGATYLAER